MTEPRKTTRCDAESQMVELGCVVVHYVPFRFARALEIETQELAEALEEAINKRAAMCEWRTDSPEVTGRPEKWVRDELCIKWRAVLASHSAKQEVGT